MQCKEMSTCKVCYIDATGQPVSLIAHYQYGLNAADAVLLEATYFTDAAGVVIDTSAGLVTAAACPVYPPDVEFEQRCDLQADGTVVQFMCRVITYFLPDGTPIDPSRTDNFMLDKVTPYVPVGEVTLCDNCVVAAPLGVLQAWAV